MALDHGWLHIERGEVGVAMKVELGGVPPWTLSRKEQYLFKETLPSDSRFAAMINTIDRIVTCFELMFRTQAEVETFLANISTLNLTGMTLEIQTTSTPTYFKWDGANEAMEVHCPDVKGLQPMALGGGSVYMIPQVTFEQTGAIV